MCNQVPFVRMVTCLCRQVVALAKTAAPGRLGWEEAPKKKTLQGK
jgi:hypothetical protein